MRRITAFIVRRLAARVTFVALGCVALASAAQVSGPAGQLSPAQVAPFVSTPMSVVDEMLRLAGVGPDDVVVDLGSGDGRLVLAAVTKFGARSGFGVDIDPTLVDYANRKAQETGATARVQFFVRDLFVTDVRDATVVTVYLLPIAMNRLEEKLLAELAPGTRVVSHDYPFRGWRAERVVTLDVPEKNDYTGRRSTSLYLYRVPGQAPAPDAPH